MRVASRSGHSRSIRKAGRSAGSVGLSYGRCKRNAKSKQNRLGAQTFVVAPMEVRSTSFSKGLLDR